MVFDVLIGAILLAFGIVAVYFSIESGEKESQFLIILLLGLAALIGGGWILVTKITIPVLLTKVAGLILAALGIFLAFEFPDITEYQRAEMSKTGILVGLILVIIGVYLLIFA
jgi:hypothetical protein